MCVSVKNQDVVHHLEAVECLCKALLLKSVCSRNVTEAGLKPHIAFSTAEHALVMIPAGIWVT